MCMFLKCVCVGGGGGGGGGKCCRSLFGLDINFSFTKNKTNKITTNYFIIINHLIIINNLIIIIIIIINRLSALTLNMCLCMSVLATVPLLLFIKTLLNSSYYFFYYYYFIIFYFIFLFLCFNLIALYQNTLKFQ